MEKLNDGVFTIDGVLTPKETEQVKNRAIAKGWNDSSPSGGGHGRTGKEDPRTNSFSVYHDPKLAEELGKKVLGHLPEDLSFLGENVYFNQDKGKEWRPAFIYDKMRIYKYEPGEEFPEHIDYKVKWETVTDDGKKVTISRSLPYLSI